MSKKDTRLDKLEANLTPKQMVLKLIDRLQQYGSFDECALRTVASDWRQLDKKESERFFEALEDKLKAQKKEPDAIYRAVKKASNEMVFLYTLFVRVMSSFIAEKYRHSYNRLYLDCLLMNLRNPIDEDATPEERDQKLKITLSTWKHRATRHLYHLYTERMMAQEISDRFFDDRDLLFKADSDLLDAMILNSESIIAKMNAVTAKDEDNVLGLSAYILDVEAVRQDVLAHLDDHVRQEVDMARADVYQSNDKTEKAFSIMGEYAEAELARMTP